MIETSRMKLLILGAFHISAGLGFSYLAYEKFNLGNLSLAVAWAGAALGQLVSPFSGSPVLKLSTPVAQAAEHAIVHPEPWLLRAVIVFSFLVFVGGYAVHLYGVFR